MGGGLILNVIRSNQCSSTYRLSSGKFKFESLGGGKIGWRAQEVKQGLVPGGKLQNGGGARGIDLLLGNVSPLHRRKFYGL